MAVIAPWLKPADALGASQAGANLGLQRAQMITEANLAAERLRQAQREAAQRTALGYAELGARERAMASEAALKGSAAEALASYRGQQLADADERLRLMGEDLERKKSLAEMRIEGANDWQTLNLGQGNVAQINRITGQVRPVLEGRTLPDPMKFETLKSLRRQLQSTKSRMGNINYIMGQDSIKAEADALQKQISALEAELGAVPEDGAKSDKVLRFNPATGKIE